MVDKDRIEGAAMHVGGKIKEGIGNLTGNDKLKAEGKVDQIEGKALNALGGLKDTLKGK